MGNFQKKIRFTEKNSMVKWFMCTKSSIVVVIAWADLEFSRGGWIFEGGRVDQIGFPSSQSTKKNLFWPKKLRRRQKFVKTDQKRRFQALFGKF